MLSMRTALLHETVWVRRLLERFVQTLEVLLIALRSTLDFSPVMNVASVLLAAQPITYVHLFVLLGTQKLRK